MKRRYRPFGSTLPALALALAATLGPGAARAEEIAAAIAPAAAPDAAPATRVPWRGDPLAVPLKVGAERRIDFPEPIVDLDVPAALERRSRVVLAPGGQLYWTPREPFEPARVLATSVGGTLYQLDVGARADLAPPPRLVVTDPRLEAAASAAAPDERARLERAAGALLPDFLKGASAGNARAGRPDYAALARFALAHYSGPARLIPKLDAAAVAVGPIDARDWVRVQSAYLAVRPLRQWKAGELYVTALGVTNRATFEVPFDPLALRGELAFAAALHPALGPRGSGHQGTVWAVVTRLPFNQAVARHASTLRFGP